MQVNKGEADAWLEGSSYPAEPNSRRKNQHEDAEDNSENEEAASQDREEYQEEDEEEFDEEEEDIEEEDEEEEASEAEEDEHNDQVANTDRRQTENHQGNAKQDQSAGKNSARQPHGSPVKRAYTTDKDNRKQRGQMSQRDKRTNEAKYMSERQIFERLTGRSLSPTKNIEEFNVYYEKFCKEFLQKKEEELEKKRKQKEEEELAQLQHKPTLISRPQSKPYVPLLERTPLLNARREKELEKIKQEKEEKLQRELEEHTFTPKINQRSKDLANSPVRERIMDAYMRSRIQQMSLSHSPVPQRKDRDSFHPKINQNSRSIMAMKEHAARDVVDRLYQQADVGRAKKNELAKKLTPKFTPSLNKNTRRIARQIEENYNHGLTSAEKQQGEVKRVDKRKRSEMEGQENGRREVAHLEQASDFELLEILKQFNGMLEQKNESPINLQQLNTLMQTYSSKKKEGNAVESVNNVNRTETEEYEEEEREEVDQLSQRRVHTEQPIRSYPHDDASNPMANIEKNLMHLQGSLQDLKENGQKPLGSTNNIRTAHANQQEEQLQSSSQSPNKKTPTSQASKSKKSKHNEESRNSRNIDEYSEGVPSKNSVGPNEKPTKTQKSSHHTPSKNDEVKAPVSTARSAKKEDFSSPAVQKGRKKAQTTTKKTKKSQGQEEQAQSNLLKEARSLNEVFANSLASHSKNSLEAVNSNFDVQDYVEETVMQNRKQPQERVRGHVPQQSFGGYPNDGVHVVGQDDGYDNYRSNHSHQSSMKKEKGKSSQAFDVHEKSSDTYSDEEHVGSQGNVREKRGQKNQSNVSSRNKVTPEKKVNREEEKEDNKNKAKKSKVGSVTSQQLGDQQYEDHNNSRPRSRKESRKVSFDMPDDSRKSSIYQLDSSQEHGRLATEPGKGSETKKGTNQTNKRRSVQEPSPNKQNADQKKGSQRKSMFEQGRGHNEKPSTFANKNKREEPHGTDSDDDHTSIQREQKANIGDYVSFSANTLDQHASFDDHQAPQDEKRVLEGFDSEASKTSSSKQHIYASPNKHRGFCDVVTTETIQIEPQSAPRFAYAMDVAAKVSSSSSGSGLKAMAEQIVKKFKAYDAQIKQTAREYKLSVSPPRTSSPSPDHYDTNYMDSGSKKGSKVFKSVEKMVPKASKASRNSVAGSVTSVQSGVDRRFSKK